MRECRECRGKEKRRGKAPSDPRSKASSAQTDSDLSNREGEIMMAACQVCLLALDGERGLERKQELLQIRLDKDTFEQQWRDPAIIIKI